MKRNILLLLSVLIAAVAFGQKSVYMNPQFESQPFKNIKTIAILPFATPVTTKHISNEQVEQLHYTKGVEYQNDFYTTLLQRPDLNEKIQDVHITNSILKKNKITIDSIAGFTPKELCTLLDVDAVILGSITRRVSGHSRHASNIIHCVVSLNNKNNTQIWRYDISEAKSMKKSTDKLISTVLKKAMREFPATPKPKKESKRKHIF